MKKQRARLRGTKTAAKSEQKKLLSRINEAYAVGTSEVTFNSRFN